MPASRCSRSSIAVGSGLAAWLAHGRIILLPTLIGAVLLGLFAIDLGWSRPGTRRRSRHVDGRSTVFGSSDGLRVAHRSRRPRRRRRPVHRADVRRRAGLGRRRPPRPRRRRRQRAQRRLHGGRRGRRRRPADGRPDAGGSCSSCSASASLAGRRRRSAAPCRPSRCATSCRSSSARCSALEVKAWRTSPRPGPTPIIALNHVSFLDAALALSLLRPASRCSPSTSASPQRWWVQAVPAAHPRDAARSDQADGARAR